MMLPLEGVRVLSVEQYGAGPFGSMYLADMGAEVIKIEPPSGPAGPGGDMSRHTGPHMLPDNDSQFFQTFNRNKRSITLDLKHPDGQAVLRALAGTADAVMNNLRGDQPDKLGLTHAALGTVKPGLVCAHLSAYGRTGPRAAWPGYDYLMQAEAGYLSLTGEPGTPPARMGLSIVDFMTGVTCAFALVSALLAAARTGQGRDIDVSLYDVAMHQLTYPATWYLNAGDVTGRRPRSGHPSIVPVETLPTQDGWVFVMCVLPKFWAKLCAILGVPELVEDPRFRGPRDRFANRDALMEILDARSRTRTTAEWMAAFGGQIPAAPVLDVAQALDNPYFRDQGGVRTVDHPHFPGLAMVANPIRAGVEHPSRPAPPLGGDTEALLEEIGMADRLEALRAAGVV
jgi:succinate---hydroxymethylglutarate CoA-transferase